MIYKSNNFWSEDTFKKIIEFQNHNIKVDKIYNKKKIKNLINIKKFGSIENYSIYNLNLNSILKKKTKKLFYFKLDLQKRFKLNFIKKNLSLSLYRKKKILILKII